MISKAFSGRSPTSFLSSRAARIQNAREVTCPCAIVNNLYRYLGKAFAKERVSTKYYIFHSKYSKTIQKASQPPATKKWIDSLVEDRSHLIVIELILPTGFLIHRFSASFSKHIIFLTCLRMVFSQPTEFAEETMKNVAAVFAGSSPFYIIWVRVNAVN
jgi:hypothetical protein